MLGNAYVKPFVMLLSVIVISGCVEDPQDDRLDAAHGQTLFMAQCAQCHGDDGRGAGPASLGLGAPPPSLTTLSQRNGGLFPRDYVLTMIDGLTRQGHPDDAMPEFGAQDMGPLIQVEEDGISTPIPADLLALATYLEALQE